MYALINLFICHFSSANKCLLKVATYAAQLEQYPKAIEIYEQVRLYLDHTITFSLIILSVVALAQSLY